MGLHGRDDGTLEHDDRLDGPRPNPYPTRIEFDEVGDYYGDETDATSEATDDYFAGYPVPRHARDIVDPERDLTEEPDGVTVRGRDGTCYHVDHLRRIFDRVCNPDDWKEPLAAIIPARAYGLVDAAVEFYTATRIRVTGGPEIGTGRILIEADGYRKGPAGDH